MGEPAARASTRRTRPPDRSGSATKSERPALGATRVTQPRDEAPPGLWNQARRAPNVAAAPGQWLRRSWGEAAP
eukprot:347481-Chlamydomonas_euryale.AAC.2